MRILGTKEGQPTNRSKKFIQSSFCAVAYGYISPPASLRWSIKKFSLQRWVVLLISIVRHSWAVRDNYFEVE